MPVNEAIRERLRESVTALCDGDLRERLWLRGERQSPTEPTFDDVVLFVVDELATREPTELVGHVLLDDRELTAFLTLSAALDELLTATGGQLNFQAVSSSRAPWHKVLAAATALDNVLGLSSLPPDVRATAYVFDNGEVAWPNEYASGAIDALASAGRRVLGLDARRLYPDGGVMEIPVSAWARTQAPRAEQVEQCRSEALAALPLAMEEGTHVLITWD